MIIDGKPQAGRDENLVDLVTPRDGSIVTKVPYASADELEQAVGAARRAFDEGPWPRMAPKQRKELMLAWVALMEEHRTELATMLSVEMGKPIADAWGIELRALINTYRWYAEIADKELDEISPIGDDLALITREPVGVVAVVTPWNFPLTLSAWKIAPALAVGCTVVHKPADLTPLTAVRIAELALEAGIPAGVLNVLPGKGSVVGKALGLHRGVAIVVGLSGVVVVLRPGQADLGLGHLAALAAALLGAATSVIVRKVGHSERAVVLMLYPMMASFVVMGLALPFVYVPVPPQHFAMMRKQNFK
jgi:gamma-glutamyl-gamma-aminobutyraldehyde dehydrogenase